MVAHQAQLLENQLSEYLNLVSGSFSIEEIANASQERMDALKDILARSSPNLNFVDLPDDTSPIHYRWAPLAKDLAILYRDVVLNASKKIILAGKESAVKGELPSEILDLISEAQQAVLKALNISTDITEGEREIWYFQNSPANLVIDQIDRLKAQVGEILAAHIKLQHLEKKVSSFAKDVSLALENRREKITSLKESVELVIGKISSEEDNIDKKELTNLSNSLQNIIFKIEDQKPSLAISEIIFPKTGKYAYPISTEGGVLIDKQFDLSEQINSWTESEIFSDLLNIDTEIDRHFETALIALFNTRNKIEILGLEEEEKIDFPKAQILAALEKVSANIEEYETPLYMALAQDEEMVQELLQIKNIYSKEDLFLPQSNYVQLGKIARKQYSYQTGIFNQVRKSVTDFFQKKSQPFLAKYTTDPIKFIDHLIIDDSEESNSLFLKKGYLGKSLLSDRSEVIDKIKFSYERWVEGYLGSICLVGNYGSGKTSLLESLPHNLPTSNIVHFIPNSIVEIMGRKFTSSHNLGDVISFAGKQSVGNKLVVCIDDLSLWQDKDISLYDSVKALFNGISKFGKRIFFVVNMNTYLMQAIDRILERDKYFTQTISLDEMPTNQIMNALTIRYNASIRELSEEEGIENIVSFAKMIAKRANGNIGRAMQDWHRQVELKQVSNINAPLAFSELILESEELLRYVLEHRSVFENKFRAQLTAQDQIPLNDKIRKLSGHKILVRTLDGHLEVNPHLVFYIDEILQTNSIT